MSRRILALGKDGTPAIRSGNNVDIISASRAQILTRPHMAYLLMDTSGSMDGVPLVEAKRGAYGFAQKAIIRGYYIGLMAFHTETDCLCHPTQELPQIKTQIDKLHSEGSTDMAGAVELGIHYMPDVQCVRGLVVVTDGYPNDTDATIKASDRAKQMGIEIVAIGTESADHHFLARIASSKDLASYVDVTELSSAISSAARLLPRE